MKILAVSDEISESIYTPLLRKKYGDIDLVLGCGDVPFFYLEFIVNALDVPLYYVPGNHDQKLQHMSDGRSVNRAEGCVELDDRVETAAPGRQASGAPLLLAGLGGCLRYNDHGQHQYTQAQMHHRAAQLAPALLANRLRRRRYLDILVTHAPPRGIHDRPTQTHTGIDAFLWVMRVFQPRYLLHGHTHRYRQDVPAVSRYRATEVINVYPYRVIEWQD